MDLLCTPILWLVALAVLVLNIPFGIWRGGVRKFSRQWFLAVHLPVPLAVGLRLMTHLGWHVAVLAVLIAAFFLGQFIGGRLRRWHKRKASAAPDCP